MKKILLSICCIFSLACAFAATGADDILGYWLSQNGQAQIQVYKEGDKYFGKIIWLKVPDDPKRGGPKKDYNNPDPALRDKPILGSTILRDFKFNDGEWTGGRVYDPQNGKEYKCYLKLKDAKTMSMRGYVGVSLLGRTEIWTRVK
ncbi:DUF2147 domain-containing protein [Sediminibacterium roseum]|uniref:DUF2147 domain-containing protein n=1 Tax=Sediminibacterium roseum TaxID=1978412 RepID=A0ABW9ZVC2_9BACT|nr:DUF2147 domain-containing protein [Sediminibacterium roseum]NCI51089.1 DUF2147 domain-containing protein [Sediminibacterium roseum]